MVKKSKTPGFIDFLNARIIKLEELIVERNGTVPMDFDKLIRYQNVRQFYLEEDTN